MFDWICRVKTTPTTRKTRRKRTTNNEQRTTNNEQRTTNNEQRTNQKMTYETAKVHWGILGVANIRKRLLPAFAKTQHAQLRAIASRSLERAKTAAAEANIPVAYGSYEQLLDDPEIEAVYIPLPNTLHDEWTRKAAEHGKHIFCEKPPTPTAAGARELVAISKAKGVRLID